MSGRGWGGSSLAGRITPPGWRADRGWKLSRLKSVFPKLRTEPDYTTGYIASRSGGWGVPGDPPGAGTRLVVQRAAPYRYRVKRRASWEAGPRQAACQSARALALLAAQATRACASRAGGPVGRGSPVSSMPDVRACVRPIAAGASRAQGRTAAPSGARVRGSRGEAAIRRDVLLWAPFNAAPRRGIPTPIRPAPCHGGQRRGIRGVLPSGLRCVLRPPITWSVLGARCSVRASTRGVIGKPLARFPAGSCSFEEGSRCPGCTRPGPNRTRGGPMRIYTVTVRRARKEDTR